MRYATEAGVVTIASDMSTASGRSTVGTPLVVDLDGTLIRTDLLVETAFACLAPAPWRGVALMAALWRGKAALKAWIADRVDVDVPRLPFDQEVLGLISAARAEGRPVYLASASNERYVAAIADHLGLFDGWFGSSAETNLTGAAKAERLVRAFGEGGFDYIGNETADLPIWRVARRAIVVRGPHAVRPRVLAMNADAAFVGARSRGLRAWLRLLRVHQWSKSALVLVPLVTAHRFEGGAFLAAVGAMIAFSFAASAIYIVNDLADVEADRAHRTKRLRPLAAGAIPPIEALLASLALGTAALVMSLSIALPLALVILAYLLLTTAYTFSFKRLMMIDVIALAALYTIRVVGGAAAISVPVSEWLLVFSMFIFTSLALVKRYVELSALIDEGRPDPTNRNYRKTDLDVVAALAVATAFNGVTIFALYISSETVHHLYRHPGVLWLVCPVLMYWLGRLMILAHRRLITDDPVVFALRDRNSLACALTVALILLGAA